MSDSCYNYSDTFFGLESGGLGFMISVMFVGLLLIGCGTKAPVSKSTGSGESLMSQARLKDYLSPNPDPPGGLKPSEVPQFITFGFDDNGLSDGMTFVLDMLSRGKNHDGEPARASFYMTTNYIVQNDSDDPSLVEETWRRAYEEGHEIGNHTRNHKHGDKFTLDEWTAEMEACNENLTGPLKEKGVGVKPEEIVGFRTPFLEYNSASLEAALSVGFSYDCSIEEGYQADQDGTNYLWPYTLDNGSPGHDLLMEWELKQGISSYPGLWEMPVYTVIVPPDEECEKYGVVKGLRAKMKEHQDYFDVQNGKITGFDYNLWVLFKMTKTEFVATLKYSLDLRLKGNRAPFLFGGHSDIYSSKYAEEVKNTSLQDRQEALEEFMDYALSKPDVRFVPMREVLGWIKENSK